MSSEDGLAAYRLAARQWLAANAELRPERTSAGGVRAPTVAVFHNMSFEDEKALIDEARAWQQRKSDAGYASIDWAPEFGGAGLPPAYARAFDGEEAATPPRRRTRRWASRWS